MSDNTEAKSASPDLARKKAGMPVFVDNDAIDAVLLRQGKALPPVNPSVLKAVDDIEAAKPVNTATVTTTKRRGRKPEKNAVSDINLPNKMSIRISNQALSALTEIAHEEKRDVSYMIRVAIDSFIASRAKR